MTAAVAPQRAYYVAAESGADSEDGRSPERAWKTLQRASAREYVPGDQLLLKRGSVFYGGLTLRGRGSVAAPIVLAAYGQGPRPIIHGLENHAIGAVSAIDQWRISGLELTSTNHKNPNRHIKGGTCGIHVSQADACESLHIVNCLIHDTSGPGIFLKAEGPPHAVYFDTVIEDCTVHHGSCGIQFDADGGAGDRTAYFERFRIARCQVHDIGGDGIVPFCSNNGVVEHCRAWRTGLGVSPDPTVDHSPVGIWVCFARKVVIQHCESFQNQTGGRNKDGGGFDIDGGCTDCTLQYNYAHDNDGAGFLFCTWNPERFPCEGNIGRFNVSVNDGLANGYGGIEFWQASNFRVHNNTVITRRGGASLRFVDENRGNHIANNLFVVDAKNDTPLVKWVSVVHENRFQNNQFWHAGGEARFDFGGQVVTSFDAFNARVRGDGQRFADPGERGADQPVVGAAGVLEDA